MEPALRYAIDSQAICPQMSQMPADFQNSGDPRFQLHLRKSATSADNFVVSVLSIINARGGLFRAPFGFAEGRFPPGKATCAICGNSRDRGTNTG
jgi:hypothetical protein